MKQFLLLCFAIVVVGGLYSEVAIADDKTDADYCNKVKARAASDSSLLFSPSLQAQFVKFPSSSPLDASTTGSTTNGYQARALAVWSPLDFYKGFGVQNVAEADCKQHAAMIEAMNVIGSALDVGKAPALKREVDFLQSKQVEWQKIVAVTDERLKANVIVITDAMQVRTSALTLDRKLIEQSGALATLSAKAYPETSKDLALLAQRVEDNSMKFEHETNHVRSLDSWTVTATAGVIPPQEGGSVEWLGVLAIGFNFGAFIHNAQDNKYLDARTSELRNARYEVRDQLKKFKDQVSATISSTQTEIVLLEAEELRLQGLYAALKQTTATATPALLNSIDLEQIDLESDRIFLEELKNQLLQWK